MAEFTSQNRTYSLKTPLGDDTLLVENFNGSEGISQLFSFELQLSSDDPELSYDDIVGQAVTLSIRLPAEGEFRYITGHVKEFEQTTQKTDASLYEMTIVPWLWFLGQTTDCRIFQEKTVPDIIKQIFDDAGFSSQYELKLEGNYVAREYCVQYRESDLNFVSRLMEEEGIFYYFVHEDGDHKLVLADSANAVDPILPEGDVEFLLADSDEENRQAVKELNCKQCVTSTAVTLKDFDFKKPATSLEVCKENLSDYEIYDYPGNYVERSVGEQYAQIRLEEAVSTQKVFGGTCTDRRICSGYTFQISNHINSNFNIKYLASSVYHAGHQDDEGSSYDCSFLSIPAEVPFRPPANSHKPTIPGCQTAIVTGPSGEEIWLDKYGRIKVQFPWDREGKNDEKSSCWIRVAQSWAGKNWGAVANPRIGQEVIVQFMEGDPDKPIVTGSVYNEEHMPPYELPANGTINALKSRSSKGGAPDNFNEIKFEDKKGEELVFIQAEKTFTMNVKKGGSMSMGTTRSASVGTNDTVSVDGDRTLTVKGNCTETVNGNLETTTDGDESHTIGGKQTNTIGADEITEIGAAQTLDVGADQTVTIGAKQTQDIGADQTLTIGGAQTISVTGDIAGDSKANIKLKAGANIEAEGIEIKLTGKAGVSLICGGSTVKVDPSGVTISGPLIKLN